MDPLGIEKATQTLTDKTLPELIAAGNALVDRLEKLLERLDGACFVFTLQQRDGK